MVRKLVLSLLSLMVLIPVSGWGLGLGDIRLNSFLNQPLDAEIDLLSVQEEDVESMTVNLASYETFARLGIERPSSLMFLKFSLEKGADERYRIKVYTKNPIKEPYLNFLLDVNWRSGRQLREYTLLLDPPDMLKQQGAPVTTAPAVSTTTERTPVAARSAPADTGAATTRVTPTPSPAPAMTSAAGDLVYGPVKSDDTLWSIAKRMRPSGDVSIYQMMMAIYQANPDAFHGGNINRLKKGKVLRVDDPASLRAMSRAEASREVMRHDREWQDYKQAVAGDASSRMAGMAPVWNWLPLKRRVSWLLKPVPVLLTVGSRMN
jgi:pilus assembly protein FimV